MKSKTVKRLATLFVAGTMFVCLPMTALAEREFSIADADGYIITVTRDGDRIMYSVNSDAASDESIVIYGTGSNKSIIINFSDSSGVDASITLKNLSINNRNTNFAPVDTRGTGNLTINLDGNNQLIAADDKAAVQTEHTGSLTIQEKADSTGKLVVQGGVNGAGIGGGYGGNGHDIIIKSGTVEATGGNDAAGIGGGYRGAGSNITIEGGTVTATGGEGGGAGIGGGSGSAGSNITIKGGSVTAKGNTGGAGIGGGSGSAGSTITIEGGTVTAKGGAGGGAGIGGGSDGAGSNITIEDGTVTATGGMNAAGIGGGTNGAGSDITIEDGTVTAIGSEGGAGIGGGKRENQDNPDSSGIGKNITIKGGTVKATGGTGSGAGIGGGYQGAGSEITIEGGTITAIGGGSGAGIGGGHQGAGENITIKGGTVTAKGGEAAAGIGSGFNQDNASVIITESAVVYAAGGKSGTILGAAIGTGAGSNDTGIHNGTELDLDLSGLYTTGGVTKFAAETTLQEIKDYIEPENKATDTKPDQNTSTSTTKIDEDKNKKTSSEEPKKPLPKEEPPAYTERSCMADVDVAALVAAALKADSNAKEITIEFDDNICLSTDMMKDLFTDSRVAKNCHFSYKGKRYNLHIGTVNTSSRLYAACFDLLSKEPDGLAGFLKMAEIFKSIGVTISEID